MSGIKLKPCPFCGGEAKIYKDYNGFYLVQCKCGCGTLHKSEKKNVINDWNTRRPMEKIVEQMEKEKHNTPYINGRYSGLQKAIKIVQKGGADEC